MGMQRRWENTARKMFVDNGITFDDPGRVLESTKGAGKELAFWHQQIREWNGFQSKSEALFEDFTQTIYESLLEGFGRGKVTDVLHTVNHLDVSAAIKSATFHLTLGGFNPIQMVVQGSGAAVALSRNLIRPDKIAKIWAQANALTAIQHMNPANLKAIDKVARAFGMNGKDLRRVKAEWDKTGLFDSVLSSADIEAAMRGHPVTMTGFRKLIKTGTLPFRMGELFMRRVSFLTALDEVGGINKLAKGSEGTKQLLTRASDFSLNLQRANRAWWQKGLIGVPTQFLQIIAKTVESYMGLNGLNKPGDKWRLLLSQLALYGGAGVPLGGMISRYVADQMGLDQQGIDSDELSDSQLRAINGGAADWFLWSVLGLDVTIADRTALLNGLDQSILSMFEKENTLVEYAAGPTGGVLGRVNDRIGALAPFFGHYNIDVVKADLDDGKVLDTVRYLSGQFADSVVAAPFSSMNQTRRFVHMSDFGALLDTKGRVITDDSDDKQKFDTATEIAVAMGFKPSAIGLKITLADMNRDADIYVTEMTDMIMFTFMDYMRQHNAARKRGLLPPQETRDKFRDIYNMTMLSAPSDKIRDRIRSSFVDRIRSPKTLLEQQTQEFYRNGLEDIVNDVIDLNTPLTKVR
jgi:hypothetical protein